MESSTARCPQCGAAIRPSARFCVTCGIKLPENTPASSAGLAASGWTAREEPASHDTDPVWAMPAPQSAAPGESDAVDDDTATASEESIPETYAANAQQPDSGSWLNWPESSTEPDSSAEALDEPEIPGEIVDLAGKQPEDANAPTADEPLTTSEAGSEEIPVDAVIAGTSTDEELATPESASETDSGNASPLDEAAYEELHSFDDFAASEWESTAEPAEEIVPQTIEIDLLDDESANEENGETVAGEAKSAPTSPDGGSLDRANALIDELRALLPVLAAPAPAPEKPRDLAAIRDRAIAARGDVSFDRYQALRDVVQDALTRPRDVEVVLRLSRRVEDMDALLSEWDRLQQAFDQLIAEME